MRQVILLAVFAACAQRALFGQVLESFEVATIKHNISGSNAIGGSTCLSGGKVSVKNIPLNLIIELAFDVKGFQLLGRPSWLNSERFDIEAKPSAPVPYSQCKLMLRTLLVDRFKLATHSESKQLPVYKLIVAKNRLKIHPVDAAAMLGIRTFDTGKGQLVSGGISMAQLAGMLSLIREVEKQVADETGLAGNYEFTLNWTPDGPSADTVSGISIFSALQEQLGLKLEAGKGPVQVLVIDHIEKVPTEN